MFEHEDRSTTEGHAMFQDLYAVARHTPLSILITPNGEQLSVIITPKPSGDASDNPALARSIKAVGTPAELDAELPAKLREYTDKVNELRTAIDLPIEALNEAQAKARKKTKPAPAKPAAKPATPAKPKKAAKPKAAKRAAPKAPAPKKKITLPGQSKSAKKHAPVPRSSLPGKPDCLSDYKALKAKFGDALTRRKFIKTAKTGRRYEKLWANWEAFIKEAGASTKSAAPAATAAASSLAAGTASAIPPSAAATGGAAGTAESTEPKTAGTAA
jgi:PRTRC genetic system protein E